jgi:hypothetical protein
MPLDASMEYTLPVVVTVVLEVIVCAALVCITVEGSE